MDITNPPDVGWLSIIPPVLAIGLAIRTKQVYLSLGLYIFLAWTILNSWNPLQGLIYSLNAFVMSITVGSISGGEADLGNARTLLFSALVGSMITLTQRSGGMEGFINWVEKRGLAATRRSVGFMTTLVSLCIFLESNFGLLVSGSVARPLFDKCRISREKLSYIIDATCAPKCILIPLNGWGAYLIALLAAQQIDTPVALILAALPFNFYAILALVQVGAVILFDWNVGPMREAERRVREEGKLLRDGAAPLVAAEVSALESKPGVPARAFNMVAPVVTMVLMVPFIMWLTGDGDMTRGSGSQAVLWGVIAGLLVAGTAYLAQGIMSVKELTDYAIQGIQGLIPLVLVLALAFTIGNTTRVLGTGEFLAQAAQSTLHPGFIPSILFLLACFIAFSTGTSWGTFAIMIPIVIPMIELLGLHPGLTIAAALGGGIFGDHCSPISDSTIVASMAAATDHIDHVRTQLPYALQAAAASLVLFLIAGFTLN